MNNETKAPNSPTWEELSTKTADNKNGEDFLIDVCRIMKDNEEYKDIKREEVLEEQKEVREADNVFTLGHFIQANLKKISKDKMLQLEIKAKLERLKKIIKKEGTEFAKLLLLELQINDMLEKNIEDNN